MVSIYHWVPSDLQNNYIFGFLGPFWSLSETPIKAPNDILFAMTSNKKSDRCLLGICMNVQKQNFYVSSLEVTDQNM